MSSDLAQPTRDELEAERWERFRTLHYQYEYLRSREAITGKKLKDDSGTATRLLTVFGKDGSLDNAWWTTWRPDPGDEPPPYDSSMGYPKGV